LPRGDGGLWAADAGGEAALEIEALGRAAHQSERRPIGRGGFGEAPEPAQQIGGAAGRR
jgi:hypothetical protein